MTKKFFIAITFIMLLFLISSCSNPKPSVDYPDELKSKQDELEKLKQQNDNLNKQIEQLQNENKILQSQLLGSLHSTWTADLTGDGINETIIGPATPTPISLYKENGGSLKVESSDGNILLDEKSGILSVVGIYNVGARNPVLITLQWGGGSMGDYYGAYLFDSDSNKLKRVQWNNSDIAIGTLEDSKCKPESIVIWNHGLKPEGGY